MPHEYRFHYQRHVEGGGHLTPVTVKNSDTANTSRPANCQAPGREARLFSPVKSSSCAGPLCTGPPMLYAWAQELRGKIRAKQPIIHIINDLYHPLARGV